MTATFAWLHGLAVAGRDDALASAVTLMVVGIGVVFVALFLVMVIIIGLRRLSARPVDAGPPVAAPRSGVDPEHLVVIAAAAAMAVGRPARVRRVVMLGHASNVWGVEGRATIMHSHQRRSQ